MRAQDRACSARPDLVEHYERLRAIALGTAAAASGHGLALLRRHGMTEWMRAWSSCGNAESPAETSKPSVPALAAPRPEIVALLAQMAMSAAKEATP